MNATETKTERNNCVQFHLACLTQKARYLFTSLPLPVKKARSSIGADHDWGLTRPVLYPPPHPALMDATPPPLAINQVRTKVKPPPPMKMCHPPRSAVVFGDGGSEVHWPLGPNLKFCFCQPRDDSLRFTSVRVKVSSPGNFFSICEIPISPRFFANKSRQ